MLKNKIICIALLAGGQCVLAADPPSAGGQLQQIPQPPIPQRDVPEIRVAPANALADTASESTKVLVRSLRVTGQTVYSEAELLSITGFVPGTELSLRDLRGMAWRIADYLHRNGYVVAQAILPAQEIREGVVTIQVMEGRYGAIRLRNESGLDNALPDGLLGGLNAGDPILIAPLESRLLLLSDIPGVRVQSTLVPGASVGASDLLIDVRPGRRVTGSVEADNAGNRYTGANRVGATVYINNPTGNGDVLGFRGLTSGSGLVYGRASYQIQSGKAKMGVAFASLRYELGREFASLDANGSAQIASFYGSYPLIRSRNTNLYALVDLDLKKFQDKVDSTGSVTDKRAQVLTASLNGNFRDQVGGGGLNNYWLALTAGRVEIQTPAAQALVAATSQSDGSFGKLSFSASRLQRVSNAVSVFGAISGQAASKNLDISEKMGLGGAYAVRAYPTGEAYADQGVLVNLEVRWLLPALSASMPGQVHLVGFVDAGSVTINKRPWTGGSNHRSLSGAGVGLTWADYNNFSVSAYYAQKLGNEAAISAPDSRGRFWLQLVKYF